MAAESIGADNDKLTWSIPEVAAALGISRALGYELVHQGVIPALRLGRRIVIPRHVID